MVKELLEFLIGQVDAQLLKCVELEEIINSYYNSRFFARQFANISFIEASIHGF